MKILKSLLKIGMCSVVIASALVPTLQAGISFGVGFSVPGLSFNIATRRAAVRIVRPRYVPVRVVRVAPMPRARVIHVAAVRRVSVSPRINLHISKSFKAKKRPVRTTKRKLAKRTKK